MNMIWSFPESYTSFFKILIKKIDFNSINPLLEIPETLFQLG